MSGNGHTILKNSLLVLLLLSPLAAIFLIRLFADWFNALPLAVRLILGFGVLSLAAIAMLVITKSKFINGMLNQSRTREQISLKRYNEKNLQQIRTLQIDRTKFKGVTGNYSKLNGIKGLLLIALPFFILIFYIISLQFDAVFFLILIANTAIAYNYFGRRIKISPDGIRCVSFLADNFMAWDKINTIGISVTASGKSNVDALIWVYVGLKQFSGHDRIVSGREENLITFKFRAKMIHHIMAYWNKEIINLENVRRWRKYLVRNSMKKVEPEES